MLVGAGVAGGVCVGTGVGVGVSVGVGVGVGVGVRVGVGGAALFLVKALMRRFPVLASAPGLYKSSHLSPSRRKKLFRDCRLFSIL